ncbi:MAG: UDP-N-acetylmuramate dehydrogenase [Candidatus Campbellbacteria bacterium]|nr:UDP-N-acetylmuramate dehydrogenase [Candidatus Campbellbacteria bacterium]
MDIKKSVLLKNMTTMKVGGNARFFTSVSNIDEVAEAVRWAKKENLPIFVLGGGSNIIVSDKGFEGLVIKNDIRGISFTDNQNNVQVTAGAGENWDRLVERSAERELYGLENLSLIPGTVGAAPVQNIGAYGSELKDNVVSVEAFDISEQKNKVFQKEECNFSYRNSLFKQTNNFIITKVTLELQKNGNLNLDYKDIQLEIEKEKIDFSQLTPEDVRELVVKIRRKKLPDWRELPTVGSFFKNPEIPKRQFENIRRNYDDLPGFETKTGKVKIPLAWIIEKICQMKGSSVGGVKVYERHALVIINPYDGTANDIRDLTREIKKCVFDKTGIEIEAEAKFIGNFD